MRSPFSARAVALILTLTLALAEAAFLLRELDGLWLAAVVALAGAAAGAGAARIVPPRALPFVAALGLLLPFLLFFAAFVVAVWTEDSALELLADALWHVTLGSPVAVAALAAAGLLRPSARAFAAAVLGVSAVSFAVAGLAGDWFAGHDPPPARYAAIVEERGAYGPVAIGSSREDLFAAFGRKPRASLREPLTPTGVEDSDGPISVPLPSEEFYRYPDAAFWLDVAGNVQGFELTSPGAQTSRGIEVGSDLDGVRAAYPELTCGEAPSGDYFDYDYCTGRIAPKRWIWFGGDPVTTIAVAGTPLG